MSNPSWVKVGSEVVFRSHGWGNRFGRITKIAKIYKNGNFTVEGGPEQYRPWGDQATRAGQHGWRSDSLCPLNEETRSEMEREQAVIAAKRIVFKESERLAKLSRDDSDEVVSEAEAIIARQGGDA